MHASYTLSVILDSLISHPGSTKVIYSVEREGREQRIEHVATGLKLAWCKNPTANSLSDVPAGNYMYGSFLHQNKYPVQNAEYSYRYFLRAHLIERIGH